MKNLKKISIQTTVGILILGFSTHGIASRVVAFPGYHILSAEPTSNGVTWTTDNPTSCPGITFPSPVSPGLTPNAENEILFDMNSLKPPYACQTMYYPTSGVRIGCLVMMQFKVKDNNVGSVQFTVFSASDNCETKAYSPSVILH